MLGVIIAIFGISSASSFSIATEKWNENCKKFSVNCPCGISGNYFLFHSQRCFEEDIVDPSTLCIKYRNCGECNGNVERCVSCPAGRYGDWCDQECPCEPGQRCIYTGRKCIIEPQDPRMLRGLMHRVRRQADPENLGPGSGKTCPKPVAPDQGFVFVEFDRPSPGDIARYSCKANYTLIGPEKRTCTLNERWFGDVPTCVRLCPFPRIYHIGLEYIVNPGASEKEDKTAGGNRILRELQFSCKEGFVLVGPKSILCTSDGQWDQEPPRCFRDLACPDPGQPENTIRSGAQPSDGQFGVGSLLRFQCHDGYQLLGYDVITCTDKGEWSASLPTCVQSSACPRPHSFPFGSFTAEVPFSKPNTQKLPEGYYPDGTVLRFNCLKDIYRLEGETHRRCLSNRKWTGQEPRCIPICGKPFDPKSPLIVNGYTAKLGEWPWQAGLYSKSNTRLVCGGAVIGEEWIITAAHCVTVPSTASPWDRRDLVIYLGKYYLEDKYDDEEVQKYEVSDLIIHPDYSPGTFDNDVALIHLSQPCQLNRRVRPICLPKLDDPSLVYEGNEGVVAGWGLTETKSQAQVLKYAVIRVVDEKRCKDIDQRGSFSPNMICAGLEQSTGYACRGDSGGGFAFDYGTPDSPHWVLEGLVSWGMKNCNVSHSAFTRVSQYYTWILSYIPH